MDAEPAQARAPGRREAGLREAGLREAGLQEALGVDAEARSGLVRMKRTATGALLVAAATYVVTVLVGGDGGVLGFVQAAAEAAMVGGLADWFAVTALFRHPLGVPVPHTALIPRKKDELATKLGEFVTGHFLTGDAVVRELAESRLVRRLAGRLADERTARRVSERLTRTLADGLDALDDRAVGAAVLDLARRDLHRRSCAPVLGRLLARAIEGQGHTPLVDVLVPRVRVHLERNRPVVHAQLRTFLEKHNHVMWVLTTDRRVAKLLDRVLAKLHEVEQQPDHPLRTWLDGLLASIATTLQDDPQAAAEVDAALGRLLDDPRIQELVQELVRDGLRSVQLSLADADGGLAQRLAPLVQDVGRRVTTDAAFERSLEVALQGAARYAVEHYGDTAVALIQRTVAEWEAKDASSRIEVAVGRDLQFIRINGTVVGALAGLAIHTGTVLLG